MLDLMKLKKYAHIEVRSQIITEGAQGYSDIMYYTGVILQQTCTYYDMLI